MGSKEHIIRATELVGVILGLFGGFLLNIVPPSNDNVWTSNFAVGMTSAFILFSILMIWSLTKNAIFNISPRIWNISALAFLFIFLISALFYYYLLKEFTYLEPLNTEHDIVRVHGNELTPIAKEWLKSKDTPIKEEMIKEFGYIQSAIWMESSTQRIELLLMMTYLLVATSLSLAVISLSEGALHNLPKPIELAEADEE